MLEGARDPVAAVVLLQRVEVGDAGESEGCMEELEQAYRTPEAQMEVRPDEEAQDEVAPQDTWSSATPFPVVDRAGLHEGPQVETGEADLLALPAVVLRPVPPVDTSSYLASALGQGGIPSQARLAGLTEELVDLALNGYPALDLSTVTTDEEFVCTPGAGLSDEAADAAL